MKIEVELDEAKLEAAVKRGTNAAMKFASSTAEYEVDRLITAQTRKHFKTRIDEVDTIVTRIFEDENLLEQIQNCIESYVRGIKNKVLHMFR